MKDYDLEELLTTILVLAIVALLIMCLWNWLIPDLFGMPIITYWQALALRILVKLLIVSTKITKESS
jgi:uncharacterized protein HemY